MGYNVYITRADRFYESDANPIGKDEWLALVRADPELTLDPTDDEFAYWSGPSTYESPWLSWSDGAIVTKNPDKAILVKMMAIADIVQATVQGEEGEKYPTSDPRYVRE